jgi:hypothetical protein
MIDTGVEIQYLWGIFFVIDSIRSKYRREPKGLIAGFILITMAFFGLTLI